MTRIVVSIFISKPIEVVFDYVTTAANWPEWHPSSKAVQGAVDHSAGTGEQIIERVRVMGIRDTYTWTVRERRVPTLWSVDCVNRMGAQAKITYTLTGQDNGTLFQRELIYTVPGSFYQWLDKLFMVKYMTAVSEQALNRLKQKLELL